MSSNPGDPGSILDMSNQSEKIPEDNGTTTIYFGSSYFHKILSNYTKVRCGEPLAVGLGGPWLTDVEHTPKIIRMQIEIYSFGQDLVI